MAPLRTLLLLASSLPAAQAGPYPFIGEWRGRHGNAVGLCTAELVAPLWVITAGHCATRMLRHEEDKVQVEFVSPNRNPHVNLIPGVVSDNFKVASGPWQSQPPQARRHPLYPRSRQGSTTYLNIFWTIICS